MAIVTPPDPLVKTPAPAPEPLMIKLPPSVKRFDPGVSVAPALMVKGIPASKTFGSPRVITPVLVITTPLAMVNGFVHSAPVVNGADLLYCRVAAGP